MQPSSRASLPQGLSAAIPIWIGYAAVGIPFGVLAAQTGLSCLQIALMSTIVFAGSSQFIAVSMIGSGASILPVIITTFFVNLRHLLMSSALSIHLKGISKGLLCLFAYGVTDESFAVNHMRFSEGTWDVKSALVVNHTANAVWIASTIVGGYLGGVIPQGSFGLDYVLTAMFIALLIFQLKNRLLVIMAAVSGVLSLLFSILLPGAWSVVISSMVAASFGVALTWYFRRSRTRPDHDI